MDIRPKTNWVSQLLGREVQLSPRKSPDEIPAARNFWDLTHLNDDLPPLAALHERVVLRTRQGTDLTAEIYVPQGSGPFPTLVYYHGGSWCLWSAAHLRKLGATIASKGFLVINVDYGLAPEHPYPWAVEDAVFAARWAAQNAATYNGIGEKIVVAGDSAGANLAAAVIVATLGDASLSTNLDFGPHAEVTFAGAFLPYGIFDFPLLFSEPRRNASSGTVETTWNLAYLGPNFISVHRNPLVSPVYWAELSKFPPAYLNCGARDALLPQSLRFTHALTLADVNTTLSVVAEADHGFLMLAHKAPAAGDEVERVCRWLAEVTRR